MEHIAVLGHQGFTGSAIQRTMEAMDIPLVLLGRTTPNPSADFSEVWCCAAPGSMAQANLDPNADLAAVESVFHRLRSLAPRRVVLISTIAALEGFGAGADEHHTIPERKTPYGTHRAMLESWVQERWGSASLVLRLPALYGPGLKKNALYDLLHPMPSFLRAPDAHITHSLMGDGWEQMGTWSADGGTWTLDRARAESHSKASDWIARLHDAGLSSWRFTHPNSTFQFYDIRRLVTDARLLQQHGVTVAHMATPPLRIGDIAHAYGVDWPDRGAKPHHESMQTAYSTLFAAPSPYIANQHEVFESALTFLRSQEA